MSLPRRSLKKNIGIAFAGNAVYQACMWGMLVILAKLTTPEEVGRFALGQAICIPVMTFAALNLRAVQVTDVKNHNTFGDFISLRIVTVVVGMLVIFGIAMFAGYPPETTLIILILGVNYSVAITREVFQSYMQKHERLDHVAVSQFISGVLALAALGVTVYLTRRLIYGVTAMLAARIFTFIVWENYSVRSIYNAVRQPGDGPLIRLNWSWAMLTALAWLALPAALMSVMTRFVTVIPQYFIEGVLGTRQLGFYAALAALPLFGQMAVMAAGSAALPRLSRLFLDRRRGFFILSAKLAAVGLGVGVLAVLIAVVGGKPLITLVFTSEYAEYQRLFLWLMIYGAVSYMAACIGYSLHATRWFWAQPAMFLVVIAVVVGLCWLWVPRYGLVGAAMAMTSGRIIQMPIALGIIVFAYKRRPASKTANEPQT
ncbi:MAG: lipopolysaccharide biosynthesis protein [Phycisphaeraceae bacterium]